MANRELFKFNENNQVDILKTPIFYDVDKVTPEFYLNNYKDFLWQYTASGQPSYETMRKYFVNIDQFLRWCVAIKTSPFKMNENHIVQYRSLMYQHDYKQASVNAKLAALKKFYSVAKKLNVMETNIAQDVGGKAVYDNEIYTRFLTVEQLQHVIDCIPKDRGALYYRRMATIIAMMGKEGLRRKEVTSMSWEDINWDMKVILIRGKGHNRHIYPGNDTLEQLSLYKEELMYDVDVKKDELGLPCFVSLSNNTGKRLKTVGLSKIIKQLLVSAGLKQKGIACHMFRHTFAVLLYAATKDLRLVQAKMGHADPRTTSKYAQSIDNLKNRYDSAIPVVFEE